MTPYQNLNGDSNVVAYEIRPDGIVVMFATGQWRNYLYDNSKPGIQEVNILKTLAIQGHGLNSRISKVTKANYSTKW